MKTVFHKADSRGHADHGWLDTYHSFSFANYYDPQRMNFGMLRVLNDDRVAAGRGFGAHMHQNMEIISIPLIGELQHKDSIGNTTIIKSGDIQVMSAGTGVQHSEYNNSQENEVRFLQIWVIPNKQNVEPRYGQLTLTEEQLDNKLFQIVSPYGSEQSTWIHQNAWFHLGNLKAGFEQKHQLKDNNNGLYAFLLEGEAVIAGNKLQRRDGVGVWGTDDVEIQTTNGARVLIMEVPMN